MKKDEIIEAQFKIIRKNALANPNLYDGRYTQKDIRQARKEYYDFYLNHKVLNEKAKNDYESCRKKYIFPDWFYDYPSGKEELQIWANQYNVSVNNFKLYMKYFNFYDELSRK